MIFQFPSKILSLYFIWLTGFPFGADCVGYAGRPERMDQDELHFQGHQTN
jgi:hypothetical protein